MTGTSESPRTGAQEFSRVLLRRRPLLLLVWVGTLVIGVVVAARVPATQSSYVTLHSQQPSPAPGAPRGAAERPSPKSQAEVMRQLAESDVFLRSVLARSGVLRDPETREWAVRSAKRHRTLPVEQRIEGFLIDHLRSSIAIHPGPGSVFRIQVDDPMPQRARILAAAVAAQFVESARGAQLEAVRAAHELSLEQHRLFKRRLEESEQRLEAFRRGLDEGSAATRVTQADVARARTLLEQADLEAELRRNRVVEQRERLGGPSREADALRLSSDQIHALMGQLKGLERQRMAALLSNDPTGDRGVLAREAIVRKLSELEVQLIRNAAAQLQSAPPEARDRLVRFRLAMAELETAAAGRTYLTEQLGRYERLGRLPPDPETELRRLTEEVESTRAVYNAFIQEVAASQIAKSFESAKLAGQFQVLGPASLPRAPLLPNPVTIVLLSLAAGGLFGVGAVWLAERRDPSVKNTVEVESLLGLPVLGAVPRIEELDRTRRPRVPGGRTPAGPGSEPGLLQRLKIESSLGLEFRRIVLRLSQSHKRLPGTLLVTSATRGEGKSLTAAGLAITIARELRENVLLVDFDLRSPALHRALGLPVSTWGLSQILQQREFDERFVRSTVVPHLDFLPAGRCERPVAELSSPEAILWFIGAVRSRYSRVVFDAAPGLAVPDALILGSFVDGVVFVVRAGTTVRKAAEFGVKVQRESRDNILGVVINDAGEFLAHPYGYQDAYGNPSEGVGGDS